MKMKKINYKKLGAIALSTAALVGPAVALGQGTAPGTGEGNLGNIVTLAQNITRIIGILIPAAFALAVLAFFWGVAKYIFSAGDEEAKGQGQRIMIGGVIGLFVISAIWGLVFFLGSTLGINQTNKNTAVPTVQGTTGIRP